MLIRNSQTTPETDLPPIEAYQFEEFAQSELENLAPPAAEEHTAEGPPADSYEAEDAAEAEAEAGEVTESQKPQAALRYDTNKVEIGLVPPETIMMTALAGTWIAATPGPHPDLFKGVRYSVLYNLVQQDLNTWCNLMPPDSASSDAFLETNGALPDFNTLPGDAITHLAWVFTKGAYQKYAPWNWAKGMSYLKVYNSCQRHLLLWAAGRELNTDDWGLHHLAHVWWNVIVLLHYELHRDVYGGHDDRAGVELGGAVGRTIAGWSNIYSIVQLSRAGHRLAWMLHYALNPGHYAELVDDRVKSAKTGEDPHHEVLTASLQITYQDDPVELVDPVAPVAPVAPAAPAASEVPVVLLSPTENFIQIPERATTRAAAFDLRSSIRTEIKPGETCAIPLGFAMALPDGYEAQIRPRSGLAAKSGIVVPNSPGTIDPDFRDEVLVLLHNISDTPFTVNFGDRIAQMVIKKLDPVTLELASVLPPADSNRTGGFGHTGVE